MDIIAAPRPFTVEGLAGRWEVAPGTIYRMIKDGQLKAFRAGKSPLRISAAEVRRHEEGEQCGDLSSTVGSGMPSAGTMEGPNVTPFIPRTATRPNGG
jgi:excisionase family DNA binding protein